MSNPYFTGPPQLIDPLPYFVRGFVWGLAVGIGIGSMIATLLHWTLR